MKSRIIGLTLCLALLISAFAAAIMPAPAVAAAGTTSLVVTKYLKDGTTVLAQKTVTYQWMQSHLPVQGDGATHYYAEKFSAGTYTDKGAVKGTDVKDLCNLVGGAASGDIIQIYSSIPSPFSRSFPQGNIYNPDPGQGKLAICWYTKNYKGSTYPTGAYVPDFTDGMLSVFLPDDGYFDNADMNTYIPAPYRAGSADGLSVKNVTQVNIFSQLWRITASARAHGSISLSGGVLVTDGTDQTFTITPRAGYQVSDVLVDGASVGAVTSYTFTNVTANHTISASFAALGLSSVRPNKAIRFTSLTVVISGRNLNRVTGVSFGDGITVNEFAIVGSTKIIANITISRTAMAGLRDVSVTAGGGTAIKKRAFRVLF